MNSRDDEIKELRKKWEIAKRIFQAVNRQAEVFDRPEGSTLPTYKAAREALIAAKAALDEATSAPAQNSPRVPKKHRESIQVPDAPKKKSTLVPSNEPQMKPDLPQRSSVAKKNTPAKKVPHEVDGFYLDDVLIVMNPINPFKPDEKCIPWRDQEHNLNTLAEALREVVFDKGYRQLYLDAKSYKDNEFTESKKNIIRELNSNLEKFGYELHDAMRLNAMIDVHTYIKHIVDLINTAQNKIIAERENYIAKNKSKTLFVAPGSGESEKLLDQLKNEVLYFVKSFNVAADEKLVNLQKGKEYLHKVNEVLNDDVVKDLLKKLVNPTREDVNAILYRNGIDVHKLNHKMKSNSPTQTLGVFASTPSSATPPVLPDRKNPGTTPGVKK